MIFSKVGVDPNEDDMMTVAMVRESSMLSSWITRYGHFIGRASKESGGH